MGKGKEIEIKSRGDTGKYAGPRRRGTNKVDLRPLKKWVFCRLPQSSLLRELILMEEDFLSPESFLAKMEIWLWISEKETDERGIADSRAFRVHRLTNPIFKGEKDGS